MCSVCWNWNIKGGWCNLEPNVLYFVKEELQTFFRGWFYMEKGEEGGLLTIADNMYQAPAICCSCENRATLLWPDICNDGNLSDLIWVTSLHVEINWRKCYCRRRTVRGLVVDTVAWDESREGDGDCIQNVNSQSRGEEDSTACCKLAASMRQPNLSGWRRSRANEEERQRGPFIIFDLMQDGYSPFQLCDFLGQVETVVTSECWGEWRHDF